MFCRFGSFLGTAALAALFVSGCGQNPALGTAQLSVAAPAAVSAQAAKNDAATAKRAVTKALEDKSDVQILYTCEVKKIDATRDAANKSLFHFVAQIEEYGDDWGPLNRTITGTYNLETKRMTSTWKSPGGFR